MAIKQSVTILMFHKTVGLIRRINSLYKCNHIYNALSKIYSQNLRDIFQISVEFSVRGLGEVSVRAQLAETQNANVIMDGYLKFESHRADLYKYAAVSTG